MKAHSGVFEVGIGVWGMRDVFVNVYFILTSPVGSWVLIDTGVSPSGRKIIRAARNLFGGRKPDAIILTHGHFDHVGGLARLVRLWQTPVYAHRLEAPFLNGQTSYLRPDFRAGGGIVTLLSFFFPRGPKDLGFSLNHISPDSPIRLMGDWQIIHTPGHTPGHISLYRFKDRILITGDAFVTTRQESLWHVIRQKKVVSGPPRYFTVNWHAARESVSILEFLRPAIVATGHGQPMSGAVLHRQLKRLANNFFETAAPKRRAE